MRLIPTVYERPTGKIPTTTVTNELARAFLALPPWMFGGQTVEPPSSATSNEFIATILDYGPDFEGEPLDNYTDERYWVAECELDERDSLTTQFAKSSTHITTTQLGPEQVITATNLAELMLDKELGGITERQAGTHLLPVGTRVRVRSDVDGHGNVRHSFYCAPRDVKVRVTGDAAGGGKYTGKIWKPVAADPSASTNLGDSDLGTLPDADDCYVFNEAEKGQPTHDLTSGTPISMDFPCTIAPRKIDDKFVCYINGYDTQECDEEGGGGVNGGTL